jgi:nicotinamidase-related amidase
MSRYCILTTDLQQELVEKNEQRKAQFWRTAPNLIRFLDDMRKLNVPIIHLQLIYDEHDKRVERHNGRLPVLRGTPGAAILPDFLKASDDVIEKKRDSGFFETRLEERLLTLGVDTVIITGMQAQICIQTTAADAHFRGYVVIIPSDGIISTRDEDRIRALAWLQSYCAVVEPMSSIFHKVSIGASFDHELPTIP